VPQLLIYPLYPLSQQTNQPKYALHLFVSQERVLEVPTPVSTLPSGKDPAESLPQSSKPLPLVTNNNPRDTSNDEPIDEEYPDTVNYDLLDEGYYDTVYFEPPGPFEEAPLEKQPIDTSNDEPIDEEYLDTVPDEPIDEYLDTVPDEPIDEYFNSVNHELLDPFDDPFGIYRPSSRLEEPH